MPEPNSDEHRKPAARSEPKPSHPQRPPRRFLRTFVPVLLILALPAVMAIWMLIVPVYAAKAEIRVRPIIPHLVFKTEDSGAIPAYQAFMNTQVSIMRSPTVLQRALDRKDVQQTDWYKYPPEPLLGQEVLSPMERLQEGLSAMPRRGTELIDVSFSTRNSKDAATIVNAVLDQHIGYISETSTTARDDIYRQLADQYKLLENEILGREKVLAKLRQQLGTSVPEELIAAKRLRLDAAEAGYRSVRLKMSEAEWRQKNLEAVIEKIKARDKGNDANAAPADVPTTKLIEQQPKYHRNADWRQIDMRIKALQHQIESGNFKPEHPTMVKLASDLKFAQEMLALRQTQLDDDWKNRTRLPEIPALPGQPSIDPERPEAAYEAKLESIKAEVALLRRQRALLLKETKTQRADFAETFQKAQMLLKQIERGEEPQAKLRQEFGARPLAELLAAKRIRLDETEAEYKAVRLKMSMAEWRQKNLEAAIEKIKARDKGNSDKAAPSDAPAAQPAKQQSEHHRDADHGQMAIRVKALRDQIESVKRDSRPGDLPTVLVIEPMQFEPPDLNAWEYLGESMPLAETSTDPEKPQAAYEAQLRSVNAELGLLKHQATLLLEEARTQRDEFAEAFQSAHMLEKENQALRHKRQLFDAVRQRLDHKEMERNVPARIEVLTRAFAPSEPSEDRRVLFTILSVLGALVVATTCGLIRAGIMSARYRIDDLAGLAGTPFLGKVRLLRKFRRGSLAGGDARGLLDDIRIVSTGVLSHVDDKPGSMVLVTSAETGDGTSTVARMLARSLARCGMKVLLVDADLLRRGLSADFGLSGRPGLAECLHAETRPPDQVSVSATDLPNLHVMPAGRQIDGCHLEQMVRGGFAKCMERCRDSYDVIVLDGPPVLPAAEARVLSAQVDGTVVVVRQGRSRRVDVLDALACLKSAGGKVLGTVLLGYERTEIHQG